ncbi:hypothetical protein LTR36_000199 [Oleoguttula mirabilis]|uniref:Uncharacterized protein n=1 Tax=Oleoguttula mirabilis TaxID=1507867 RepID=A0AAV9JZ21_9PEZI|nr:hypothetical protein LTR36_000199 [Oleoguttula mirabilis]
MRINDQPPQYAPTSDTDNAEPETSNKTKYQHLLLGQVQPGKMNNNGQIYQGAAMSMSRDAVRMQPRIDYKTFKALLRKRLSVHFGDGFVDGKDIYRMWIQVRFDAGAALLIVDDETWGAGRQLMEQGADLQVVFAEVPAGYCEPKETELKEIEPKKTEPKKTRCAIQ